MHFSTLQRSSQALETVLSMKESLLDDIGWYPLNFIRVFLELQCNVIERIDTFLKDYTCHMSKLDISSLLLLFYRFGIGFLKNIMKYGTWILVIRARLYHWTVEVEISPQFILHLMLKFVGFC
jgi:hypothetical protein